MKKLSVIESKEAYRADQATGMLPFAISMEDAPRLLGVSRSHIYRLSKKGLVVLKKSGRKTLILTDSMILYLQSLPLAQEYTYQLIRNETRL